MDWTERAGRIGFFSRGVVYLLLGWIALRAAVGSGQATDSRGALRSLLDEPLGRGLVGTAALGLLCYALWRAYAASANPEHDGAGKRLHHAGIAIVHGALALWAARVALSNGATGGGGADSGNRQAASWAAEAMALPVGRWLVAAAGAVFAGYGLYQIYRGATADLDDMLDLSPLGITQRRLIRNVSRFGIAARGVVFIIIGAFVIRAAIEYDAAEARGFAGALVTLEQQPWGPWLLGVVSLGLIMYGVYGLVRARYRVIVRESA